MFFKSLFKIPYHLIGDVVENIILPLARNKIEKTEEENSKEINEAILDLIKAKQHLDDLLDIEGVDFAERIEKYVREKDKDGNKE